MVKVMAFGTFDILHPGHLSYLKQAKEFGDELVVVVATDANVEKMKNRKPVNNQEHRKELVEAIGIVDKAIIGYDGDMFDIVAEENPDVLALGYDQKPGENKLKELLEEKEIFAEVKTMKPYRNDVYKSSKIKEKVKNTKN